MNGYVISYDIVDDRRRSHVARLLKGYGERVQRSVFEVHVTDSQMRRLAMQVERRIKKAEDTVRIYPISGISNSKMRLLGIGKAVEEPKTMVV